MNQPNDKPPWGKPPYPAPNSTPNPNQQADDPPSVFDEPWMKADAERFNADVEPVPGAGFEMSSTDANPENSVWDEPGLSRELSGATPADGVTWFKYYHERVAETSATISWVTTFYVALASGICAILGALFLQVGGVFQIVMVSLAAPVTEEIMKIALAIWIVEKRPWLFRSTAQIMICGLVSGFVFAAIENVFYLYLGEEPAPASQVAWRWTVCVALHVTCTLIASVGVATVWSKFQRDERMPRLANGAPWIVAAMIVHGVYNFSVTVLAATGFEF